MKHISIHGAKTHNLKSIDLVLPRDKIIVITGVSGSGKSSLAFDTLYAEGQRRYVESLSSYARQFIGQMKKADCDGIEGLSPAISIEQKATSHNPRSTVGTVTEIYDYLRLLYARIGTPKCPDHNAPLKAQTISQMVDQVLALPYDSKLILLAPIIRDRKGEHAHIFQNMRAQGFIRARIDGLVVDLDDAPVLEKNKKHTIEIVVDRFKVKPELQLRLSESFEAAVNLSEGLAIISSMDGSPIIDSPIGNVSSLKNPSEILFSARFACPVCNYSIDELEPRMFSFNSPAGACPDCDGLGVKQFFDIDLIVQFPECSISEGAIRSWDRKNLFYFNILTSLAKHYEFDIDSPFQDLQQYHQQVILFGSGQEIIEFNYSNDKGAIFKRSHTFEGIVPNMERRHKETESHHAREELAKYLNVQRCRECDGARLKKSARHVFIDKKSLPEVGNLPVGDLANYYENLHLEGSRGKIAEKILKEIRNRLNFLVDVGLNYLNLNRSAESLSGGEAQRIRLASQIGAGLVGVMYILDEPSIGLHQRDNERLLATLTRLRDIGNTVIVVEHDEEAIREADYIVDIGPGAGIHGGEIVAKGSYDDIINEPRSLTGDYLSGRRKIIIPEKRTVPTNKKIMLNGASGNNLQDVNLELPVGLLTCITGVSGSGKSTLINETLYPIAATELNKATTKKSEAYESITGMDNFDKCVDIDQSPIGRTPRSNPATYTGIFTPIRELFAGTQEARSRGYKPGRFSFNVKGGRCEACKGEGTVTIEMQFMADVHLECDVCNGKRYNRETLEVTYKRKNISQVLDLTVEDALIFFEPVPSIARKLQTLIDVGLSYIKLGQAATTLSGGEAQRVKLSKELSKRDTGNTLYILDEPTTGLHFHDIQQLLIVLHRLRDHGNTVVVIEHNLDVIKTADWVVDLGPEGGAGGGKIIATGTPEDIAQSNDSPTGHFLKKLLG